MKKYNPHKKELIPKQKDQIGDKIYHPKIKTEKVKYRHKQHWLEEEEIYEDDLFSKKSIAQEE
jgi:hypothetical protein